MSEDFTSEEASLWITQSLARAVRGGQHAILSRVREERWMIDRGQVPGFPRAFQAHKDLLAMLLAEQLKTEHATRHYNNMIGCKAVRKVYNF